MRVKVIKVPFGDAPELVRREWVGLVLEAEGEPSACKEMGLESLEDIPDRGLHFHVPAGAAFEVLARKSPDAANWFRRNVPPDVSINFGVDEVEILS